MATVDNQKHYNQNISVSIAKYVNIHTKWIEKKYYTLFKHARFLPTN